MGLRRRNLLFTLVEHLDVTAEGHEREHILGRVRVTLNAQQGTTETDREAQHLHPEASGDPEVTEFVDRNEDRKRDDKGADREEDVHLKSRPE